MLIQHISMAVVGIVIGLYAAWKLVLTTLALMPLIVLAGGFTLIVSFYEKDQAH